MEIIYLMVLCSVSLAIIFLIIFIVGTKRGQFEDDESPAVRILLDDELKSNDTMQDDSEKNNKSD